MSGRGGRSSYAGRGGGSRGGGRAGASNPLHTGSGSYRGRGRGRAGGRARGGGDGGRFGGADERGRSREQEEADALRLEALLGYEDFSDGETRLGFLMNMSPGTVAHHETGQTLACVNCYFMCQDGSTFKAQVRFAPYFLLAAKHDSEQEVESYLRRRFEGMIASVEQLAKEDLGLKNHLSGLKRKYLKVSFATTQELMDCRRELMPLIARNKAASEAEDAYDVPMGDAGGLVATARKISDFADNIVDIREYDVPYHHRFAIDTEARCGQWYDVRSSQGSVTLSYRPDLLLGADMRVCAFDIECTKMPLQFPNAAHDQVFMISYMVDGQGYLIINREIVSEDIQDFEYTPKPEYKGPFKVFNERDEKALLRKFFDHMRCVRPCIYVTYNGDFFDWPFLSDRAGKHGWNIEDELSVRVDTVAGEARSKCVLHMDAFAWVRRDSYLPQGSQGLKAVTRAKLGYDPVEVDPEEMVRYAQESPQKMATYSVSDAVCTYYLYMTYVHPFIFSLCKIIPMSPDEVLRKGSGTLCEALLMVEAYRGNIVAPNKQTSPGDKFFNNHLIESETYIGGHVECLESGVFRDNLPSRFNLKPAAFQKLIDEVDLDLTYALKEEAKLEREDVQNYEEVRAEIVRKLEGLRDAPKRDEFPLIYHLDVAAMYPNIILTNRLQPPAVVTPDICAACSFNTPGKTCLRPMEWVWRGEHYMATRSEYNQLRAQLEVESFPDAGTGGTRYFRDLPQEERERLVKERLKKYCQKVYKRVLDKPSTAVKTSGVCMRENPFYVDTVRLFRDRRYEYKGLHKKWQRLLKDARAGGNPVKVAEASGMVVLYDSLQLAHKCILNSFYGYVMRRGARWYSMEMAGVVTYTGAAIIQRARQLVEQIGKPLELDTDGIWCALPASFPENYPMLRKSDGSEATVLSYPCIILNRMVALHNTNEQYATLQEGALRSYKVTSEMSIQFEVDGPYKAMILPASKEEDKLIKKRYAVFDKNGRLAELKGFEMKRRGELKLIKAFQTEVFGSFLEGDTLEGCYAAVAAIANRWLDMLETKGEDLDDVEMLEYISESTVMSKSVEEYGDRKSAAITTAARLAQFLGDDRLKDKGLKCEYIVASKPVGAPTSERVIPTQIFSCEPAVARAFLRKWTRDVVPGDPRTSPDPRYLVDWDYYATRLGGAIQKIITIPAALQRVPNPVPRVKHPDWLARKVREKNDPSKQLSMRDMFARAPPPSEEVDMEDAGAASARTAGGPRPTVRRFSRASELGGASPAPRAAAAAEAPAPETPQPDKSVDYDAWLQHAKRKWAVGRAARKKAKLDAARGEAGGGAGAGGALDEGDGPGTGVGAIFRRADAAAAAASHWQLLQLTASPGAPGSFTAWAVVGESMYAVPLRVPRTFYVSLARPDAAADAGLAGSQRLRVRKQPPHGMAAPHLYCVQLEESAFLARGVLAAAAPEGGALADVVGVYESQLALQQQAALSLGCCAAVARGAQRTRRPLGEGFSLQELEMKATAACPYLLHTPGALRYISLYSAESVDGERAINALFLPALGAAARCLLVITQRRGGAREVTLSAALRALRSCLALDPALAAQAPELGDVAFEVTYVRSAGDAHAALARALGEHGERHRGPVVALVESTRSEQELRRALPALQGVMPMVRVPANAADLDCLRPGAASLGWQPAALRLAVRRVAACGPWLRERARLAAYAHLPLGNFGDDWVVCVADAFFSRALRDAGHLLWASPSGEPDLGGGAADAAGAAGASAAAAAAAALGSEEDDAAAHACVPGAYRSCCVELRLHNLAVCALVNAHLLPDIGLDDAAQQLQEGSPALGGAQAALGAFRVLRTLVANWLADATERGNAYADALLTQLYRWLSSPSSSLRDPALLRLVRLAMRRLFKALLSELQRLGGRVVYADFGTVQLATGRSTPQGAADFVAGLRAALQGRELFSWLDLVPSRTWHALLFRDTFNYGGVEALPLQPSDDADADADATAATAGEPKMVSNWNLAQYLPLSVQEPFEVLVSEFIYQPWKAAQDEAAASVARQPDGSTATVLPCDAAGAAAEEEGASARCVGELVNTYFTHKLIRLARDVAEKLGDGVHGADGQPLPAGDPAAFPGLPGSHLSAEQLGTPALAFVRAVCEVFSLDARCEAHTGVLRKQLLRLLRVREFSPEAAFVDPCASLALRDVLCAYCNDVRDLDLCRDPQLALGDWSCPQPGCRHPYDQGAVQARLVTQARAYGRAYALQDLACERASCRRVKAAHLADRCPCGGRFSCTTPPAAAAARLRVLHSVARFHGFSLLEETAAFHLGLPYDGAGGDSDSDQEQAEDMDDDSSSSDDDDDGPAQQRRRRRRSPLLEEEEEEEEGSDRGDVAEEPKRMALGYDDDDDDDA